MQYWYYIFPKHLLEFIIKAIWVCSFLCEWVLNINSMTLLDKRYLFCIIFGTLLFFKEFTSLFIFFMFTGIPLFLLIPHYPIDVCRIYSDITFFTLHMGNLYFFCVLKISLGRK